MAATATRMIKTITVALAILTITMFSPVVRATASVNATSKTVVYGFGNHQIGWAHPEVRPTHATFSLAGEDGIKRIRWRDWRRSSAFGHGLHLLFTGTYQKATIDLSGVRTHKGQRYFSHLVMRWTTKNGRHHTETLNWRYDKGVGWLWVGNFQ